MKIITTLIVLIIVVCAWFISSASADNVSNVNDCIKENFLVYTGGKWTEKEVTYPWSKCFDIKNSEKFDGFAFESVKKIDVDELRKEAREKVFSILVDVGLPGEKENNTGKAHDPLDSLISVATKRKISDDIVNEMDEKEIFRFVFKWIVVGNVAEKIKKLDSYGGLAIDEDKGLIFVYLNGNKDKRKIKEILNPYIDKGVNVVFLKGKWTSSTLKEWKERTSKNKPADITITTLSYDVFLNKVIIGVPEANNETLKKINNYLKKINIPLEEVYVKESIVEELSSRTGKTRPLIGGLQIGINGQRCTLGFVAKINGVKGFVTAGHCSPTIGTAFCQPGSSGCTASSNDFVGKSTKTTCPGSNKVWADVAWIPTTESVCSSIYRDSSSYHHIVAGKNSGGGNIGETVCKSGAVTGETCGTVKCTEGNGDIYSPACKKYVMDPFVTEGMKNDFGDSGSPVYSYVFYWNGYGYVSVYGVLWGGDSRPQFEKAYYSSIGDIEYYVGSLDVTCGCI